MQPFERKENLFGKLGIKALTVIGDGNCLSQVSWGGTSTMAGFSAEGTVEFPGT
jgi:hypothetical protein